MAIKICTWNSSDLAQIGRELQLVCCASLLYSYFYSKAWLQRPARSALHVQEWLDSSIPRGILHELCDVDSVIQQKNIQKSQACLLACFSRDLWSTVSKDSLWILTHEHNKQKEVTANKIPRTILLSEPSLSKKKTSILELWSRTKVTFIMWLYYFHVVFNGSLNAISCEYFQMWFLSHHNFHLIQELFDRKFMW